MKIFLYIFIIFIFIKNIVSKDIIFGASGIAKVGDSCFLSIFIKNKSEFNIQELKLNIFSTDIYEKLIGQSNITLKKLNKNQPYNTSIPIKIESHKECKSIRNIKVLAKKCMVNKKLNKQCRDFLKIEKNFENNYLINTKVIHNSSFFKTDDSKSYLEEFGVYLKKINSDYANKYKIKNNTFGLLVVEVSNSNTFLEGDLITEVEMTEVKNIDQLKKQLKIIFEDNKNHILISFIRDNNEKLVAVKLN